MRRAVLPLFAATIALVACGGAPGGNAPGAKQPAVEKTAKAPAIETRWLRGLWATDIRKALPASNLTCEGPRQEGQSTVWACEWGPPLIRHKVVYYGSAPGKIEYINATVTQPNQPKDAPALSLFTTLAGLHFEGAEPARAREWVQKNFAAGGGTVFGPAKFKLSGDVKRRMLEIKASGSEW